MTTAAAAIAAAALLLNASFSYASRAPVTVVVDTSNVTNPALNPLIKGCHLDYGFSQAPRFFSAELVYSNSPGTSNYGPDGASPSSTGGTCSVPAWNLVLDGGASGSMETTDYTPFGGKDSLNVQMGGSGPVQGQRVGIANRGLCGSGLVFEGGQPYDFSLMAWANNYVDVPMFAELRDFTTNTTLALVNFTLPATGPPWGSTWQSVNFTLTPSAPTTCTGIPYGSDPTIDCGVANGPAFICVRCGGELVVGLWAPGAVAVGFVSLMPGPWGRIPSADGSTYLPVLKSAADVLTSMGVTLIRAGGSVSQSMRWRDWRGPRWGRPSLGQNWGFSLLETFGPFEIIDMCNSLGIVPAITLAYDLNDDLDWADLVEYCWGDATTSTLGRRRARDGHPAVYNVTVFELGNEQYNPYFVDQVLAMEERAKAIGVPAPLHYMFPQNQGLNAADAARLLAAAPDVVPRVLADLHVGAGGAVDAASELFANPPVPGFDQGAINAETNAGTFDMQRALDEASDLIAWMTAPAATSARLFGRTASFCSGTASSWDSWAQGISFFLPNMTWFQPPGYVHTMLKQTWAETTFLAQITSTATPSYALQTPGGFLADGGDLFSGPLTLAEAEAMCTNLTGCLGITFAGTDPNPTSPVTMYLKNQVAFSQAAGWQSYVSSRAGLVIPVSAHATADGRTFVVRAVNPHNDTQPLTVTLTGPLALSTASAGTTWTLAPPAGVAAANAGNTAAFPTYISPVSGQLQPAPGGQTVSTVMPAASVVFMSFEVAA